RIGIIGAGNWGTALAIVAARAGHEVHLWARDDGIAAAINSTHRNPVYLQSAELPDAVRATSDLKRAVAKVDQVVLVVPSQALRLVVAELAASLSPDTIVVSATKGIEIESGKRMSQVVDDVLGPGAAARFVCLSGPSFAKEVIKGH